MGMDIGAITPFTHALRERENINDLLEELCGARLTFNYMRIGGVAWDLPPGYAEKVLRASSTASSRCIDEYNALISVQQDLRRAAAPNVAVISAEEAINYNLVGPNLRGSGVRYDVRRDDAVLGLSRARVRRAGRHAARSARSATASTATWCACAR